MLQLRLQTARTVEVSQAKMISAESDTTVGARGMSNDQQRRRLSRTRPKITG